MGTDNKEKIEKIEVSKEDLINFMNDCAEQLGCWSDTSYRLCEFIGIDPTQGT